MLFTFCTWLSRSSTPKCVFGTFGSRWARAVEVVHEVDAGSTVMTWVRMTLIDIVLAVHSLIPWFTLRQTERHTDRERKRALLPYIHLTTNSFCYIKSIQAAYLIFKEGLMEVVSFFFCFFFYLAVIFSQIVHTRPSIPAGTGQTLIYIYLTVAARPALLTRAEVCIILVFTHSTILTQLLHCSTWKENNKSHASNKHAPHTHTTQLNLSTAEVSFPCKRCQVWECLELPHLLT